MCQCRQPAARARHHPRSLFDPVLVELLAEVGEERFELLPLDLVVAGIGDDGLKSATLVVVEDAIGVRHEEGRLDEVLRECWESGVVLSGVSAGSICWL